MIKRVENAGSRAMDGGLVNKSAALLRVETVDDGEESLGGESK